MGRNQWRKGSVVEMYSEKAKKWMKGEVLDIFNDREGEWLVVKAGYRTGEIQRFSNFIRVAQGGKKKQTKKQHQKQKKYRCQQRSPNIRRHQNRHWLIHCKQMRFI